MNRSSCFELHTSAERLCFFSGRSWGQGQWTASSRSSKPLEEPRPLPFLPRTESWPRLFGLDRASLEQPRAGVGGASELGNANCATGPAGLRACRQICGETARLLGVDPRKYSHPTGIIGVPLPAVVVASPARISWPGKRANRG